MQTTGGAGKKTTMSTTGGNSFPAGIDKSILNEEEINRLLQITSEKSLAAIARETEKLAGEGGSSGAGMTRGDMKVSLQEIEDFMKEISMFKTPKINRKELKKYLEAFGNGKVYNPKEIAFLMNGKSEIDAQELHELLAGTQIEEFDAVEEAYNLLLGDSGQKYLTIETFRTIFKALNLGEIAPSDEEIFLEVAKANGDKTSNMITLDDFRNILTYKPQIKDPLADAIGGGHEEEEE